MGPLTIHEAAQVTGWSPRMLRYVERAGLVVPARSRSGYRLYSGADVARLRSLRDLLDRHAVGLAEVGFAQRLRIEPGLREAVDGWLEDRPDPASADVGQPASGGGSSDP